MKLLNKKTALIAGGGVFTGIVNSILGAGGGMLAVPLLKLLGLDTKASHSNAVAVILPISILSAYFYLKAGYVTLKDSFIYIPTGLLGAIAGTFLLRKISSVWLNRIFGAFMIYAGIRLLLK